MKEYEARYLSSIKRIGGAAALAVLPELIKKALRETTDLPTKTKMLIAIAEAMEGVRR